MKNLIVGTAGHVDHGKTTLIKALTGYDADTLEEEKRRGITINLGFTYFDLPSKTRVGIVDVPGHEKFIKNMMAGAFGMDVVLLVIDVNNGIMPQTTEHIDILSYLDIKNAIIVLTKCDTLDDEFIELVKDDIKINVQNTFLQNAPIVEVDSLSGRGIDDLITLLDTITENTESKDMYLKPRLNIDRVFNIKGHGTVVTGTLLEGKLNVGDSILILPSEIETKIRSLQVHGENVSTSFAGKRTAINLANVDKDKINRGDIITVKNNISPSNIINVKLSLVSHTNQRIKHWSRLRLFHGTTEIICRAVPLDKKEIKAGDNAFVQLRLETPLYAKVQDKFIIRSYSPVNTIGGGKIIELESKKYSYGNKIALEDLKIKENGSAEDILYKFILKNSKNMLQIENLSSVIGKSEEATKLILENLIYETKIVNIGNLYFSKSYIDEKFNESKKIISDYHRDNPLKNGIGKNELKNKLFNIFTKNNFDKLLDYFYKNYEISYSNGTLCLKSHNIKLNDEDEKIKEDILSKLNNTSLDKFISYKDLCENNKTRKNILDLIPTDIYVKLIDDFYISKDVYDKAFALLLEHFKNNKTISVKEYKDLINAGRRNTIVLLETFDKLKITKRQGDDRILMKLK